ncbi:hypothetical protein ABEX78_23265 [Priestia megaterium]
MEEKKLDARVAFKEIEKAIENAIHKSHKPFRNKLVNEVKRLFSEYEEEMEDLALSGKYQERLGLAPEEMIEIPKGMSPVDYYLQNKEK